MSAPPFMPLYIADYHADTTHLNRGEHGAYLLLIMAMWRAGGRLPANDAKLARLAMCSAEEWAEIRQTIMEFFKRRGGVISHKRMSSELAKYENKIVQRSNAGKASAAKKANENNENSIAPVEVPLQQNSTNQNQNQNQIKKEIEARKRAARIDPDWKPGPDDVVYATVKGLIDIEGTGERFRNYWTAKAGATALKLDWSATWRNWVLDEIKRQPTRSQPKLVEWC